MILVLYFLVFTSIDLEYYKARLDYGNDKDVNLTSQVNRVEYFTLKYAENYNTDAWISDLP